ncbi:hypothetical protein ACGF07_32070 [Kitasatospora sp. NPDC048194]|uniref:hypothetical protein n=1 Tax=Kitasatospora sp. NPDC048194 TaxID=3364045 RepID=UPI0037187216
MAQPTDETPEPTTVQRNGRPAVDAAGIAQLAGMSLRTWQRNRHQDFTAVVVPIPGTRQPLLYDLAQARAFLAGEEIPALETSEPRPDDLLTDKEAGAVAGIAAGNLRTEAAAGLMDPGIELLGRRWWTRAAAEERRGVSRRRGRIAGTTNRTPRERPADARAAEVADELAAAERGERGPVTTGEVADRYQLQPRTAERTLARARELHQERPQA